MDAILVDVLKNGVSQAELDRVRDKSIAEQVYTLDDQAMLARIAGVGIATGLDAKTVFARDAEMLKVTTDDIKQAAAKVIAINRSVTGILLPETPPQN